MKRILQLFCLTIFPVLLNAQLPDGASAPNFQGVDINGNNHNLYDLLEQNKTVILDFSATWCGPCWSYHTSGALHDFMETYGPDGTDEAMVFYIECDPTTTMADLNGTGPDTTGDWVTNTNYPIIDYAYIANQYQIGAYPTIVMVCPDRKLEAVGTLSAEDLGARIGSCPTSVQSPEVLFSANEYFTCDGSLEVQFTDNSWPRGGNYLWDFGDGGTSTEVNPTHIYPNPGTYTVTLKVENNQGESSNVQADYILVGDGMNEAESSIGPVTNDIGGGRIFEGGHQGLIFDAHSDIVISSVYVYSEKEEERTVVVLDGEGNLYTIKDVIMPEGESRVDLNIYVAQGTDYTLGLYSDAYLFRNSDGAVYPYELDNLVSITRNTAGSSATAYYYYYYDWKVRPATCSEVSNNEELQNAEIEIYPNPASSFVSLKSDLLDDKKVIIYDVLGKRMNCVGERKSGEIHFNIEHLNAGIYLISIGDTVRKFTKN